MPGTFIYYWCGRTRSRCKHKIGAGNSCWRNDTIKSKRDCLLQIKCIFQLKVFPEASRTAVYSYLGIPYAQPPVGKLRFSVNIYLMPHSDTSI